MTDTPHSLLNITGKPSVIGDALVKQQKAALDMLNAGHPKHDGKQDGPQTFENAILMAHIARMNK